MSKKKVKLGRPYKAELVVASGGPFSGGRISMSPSQLGTLVFRVKGCAPGTYERRYTGATTAFWTPEPIILRRPACGASL